MDCSPPGSSVLGISQARKLEWVAISFSRRSSWSRDRAGICCISRWILYHWATSSVQLLSYIWLFVTPWHSAQQTASPTPGACSNSCPSSRWCHPTISSSVIPFSSCLQSFPAWFFSSESVLHIRWPKYWSFSFSISSSSEYSGLISFTMDWLDLFAVRGPSRVLSNTIVQKHQFFGTQLSLWSSSHFHTWLLEKPYLWSNGPLFAK